MKYRDRSVVLLLNNTTTRSIPVPFRDPLIDNDISDWVAIVLKPKAFRCDGC